MLLVWLFVKNQFLFLIYNSKIDWKIDTMIVQERSIQFSKSRPFFGAFLGASRTTEIFKSNGFIGFDVCNLAAREAAKLKSLSNLFLELMSFSFLWKPSKINGFRFLFHKQPIKEIEFITPKMVKTILYVPKN